eukprot:4224829-Pyramimonas_sp.AAC.1
MLGSTGQTHLEAARGWVGPETIRQTGKTMAIPLKICPRAPPGGPLGTDVHRGFVCDGPENGPRGPQDTPRGR